MAAPVEVAQALPWLNAGAVHTAWVGDAFIAIQALPSIQTPATQSETRQEVKNKKLPHVQNVIYNKAR